jgi:hypothetical protein
VDIPTHTPLRLLQMVELNHSLTTLQPPQEEELSLILMRQLLEEQLPLFQNKLLPLMMVQLLPTLVKPLAMEDQKLLPIQA